MADDINTAAPMPEPVPVKESSIDLQRAHGLLNIVSLAVAHGTAYGAIIAEANAELAAMNKDAQKVIDERTAANAKAMAEWKANEAIRQQKLADAAAKETADNLARGLTQQQKAAADKAAADAASAATLAKANKQMNPQTEPTLTPATGGVS